MDQNYVFFFYLGSVLSGLFFLTLIRLLAGWLARRLVKRWPQNIGRLLIINVCGYAVYFIPALISILVRRSPPDMIFKLLGYFTAQSIIFSVDAVRYYLKQPASSVLSPAPEEPPEL